MKKILIVLFLLLLISPVLFSQGYIRYTQIEPFQGTYIKSIGETSGKVLTANGSGAATWTTMSFLPLSGGTLSGALTGTSVTLSGDIAVNGGDILTTGTELKLNITSGTSQQALRVLRAGGWIDNKNSTFLQLGKASGADTSIISGAIGSVLNRLGIVSSYTTITSSHAYNAIPIPIANFNVYGTSYLNGAVTSTGTINSISTNGWAIGSLAGSNRIDYTSNQFRALGSNDAYTGFKASVFESTAGVGNAPFVLGSTALNTNLNADLLDGQHGAYYQPLLTNPNIGTGSTNYLAKFTGLTTLGSSQIYDNGTKVGIGNTVLPSVRLTVSDDYGLPATSGVTQTGSMLRLVNPTGSVVFDFGQNGSGGGWLQTTNSANLSLTYPIMLNPNGGPVFIGKTTGNEDDRLQVSGTISGSPAEEATQMATWGQVLNQINGAVSGTTNYVAKFTGINTLGVSTIYDNGTAIGIGTTTPTARLDIVNGGSGVLRLTNTEALYGEFQKTSVDFYGRWYTVNPTEMSYHGSIQSVHRGSGYHEGSLRFLTAGSSGATEKMRILYDGNVGIGTATPTHLLQLNTTNETVGNYFSLNIRHTATNANSSPRGIGVSFSDTYTTAGTGQVNATIIAKRLNGSSNYRSSLSFNINSSASTPGTESNLTEAMTIDYTGNVGIGTNAPGYKLEVNGAGYFSGTVKGSNALLSNEFVTLGQLPTLTNVITNSGASADNQVARFDGTTGKVIQNSGMVIDDNGNVSRSSGLVNSSISHYYMQQSGVSSVAHSVVANQFNRLQGAERRYTITTTNVGATIGMFDIDTDSRTSLTNKDIEGVIEVDFNPALAWTANTTSGFVYAQGTYILSFYSNYRASNIKLEQYYRNSGTGLDEWKTLADLTGNTTSTVYISAGSDIYIKKIRLTLSGASAAEIGISDFAWYPSRESATSSKSSMYIPLNGQQMIVTTPLQWQNTSAAARLHIDPAASQIMYMKQDAASDLPTLGSELILVGDLWTSTGWTGDWATGWTHTVGNTSVLSDNTLAAVIGNFYYISYTMSGRTAGSVQATFGGVNPYTSGIVGNGVSGLGVKATTTAGLTITPTTDFDGKLVISIKQVTGTSTALLGIRDAANNVVSEIRGSTHANASTIFGENAGYRLVNGLYNSYFGHTSGSQSIAGSNNTGIGFSSMLSGVSASQNTGVGAWALYTNILGSYNSAFGYQSLYSNTASYNTAYGSTSLFSNTTGNNNTGVGYGVLQNNTTGSGNAALGLYSLYNLAGAYNNNTAIGIDAGRYYGSGTSAMTQATTGTYIGASTRGSANTITNETVLGYNAIGAGANTVQLGNTSVTDVKTSGKVTHGQGTLSTHSALIGDLSSGSWAGKYTSVSATNLSDGYIPYHSSDNLGLANSSITTNGTSYVTINGSQTYFKNGGNTVFFGADINLTTLTANTTKTARYLTPSYANSDYSAPYAWAVSESNPTDNKLLLGGGTGNGYASTYISFLTAANATTTTGTERMRIDNAGNVGIGTTAPATPLQIGTTLNSIGAGDNKTVNFGMVSRYSTGAVKQYNVMGYYGTTVDATDIFLQTGGETSKNFYTGIVSDGGYFNSDRFSIIGNGNERLSILQNGNVGIGTVTPGAKLHLSNATGSTNQFITTNDINANAVLYFSTDYDGTPRTSFIGEDYANNRLAIGVGGSLSLPAITVNNSTGYVGVNVSAAGEQFEVGGKTKTTNFQMTSGATAGYFLQSDASGNGTWTAVTSGAGIYLPLTGGTLTGDLAISKTYPSLTFNSTINSDITEGTKVFNIPFIGYDGVTTDTLWSITIKDQAASIFATDVPVFQLEDTYNGANDIRLKISSYAGGSTPNIMFKGNIQAFNKIGFFTDWSGYNLYNNPTVYMSKSGSTLQLTDPNNGTVTLTNLKSASDNEITSMAVTGSSTKTITLTQKDLGTLTASFVDDTGSAYSDVFINNVYQSAPNFQNSGSISFVEGTTNNFTANLTTIGTISAGAYTNPNITVGADGRITLISNGSGGAADGNISNVSILADVMTFTGTGGGFNGTVTGLARENSQNDFITYNTFTVSRAGSSVYVNNVNGLGTGVLASGGYLGVDANGASYDLELGQSGKIMIQTFAAAPASSSATGTTGTVIITADYIYVCTATNTWKRVATSTW